MQLTGQSFKKFNYSPVYVPCFINDFFYPSVGKQLEMWHLARVYGGCHLALNEGSSLPKIVGATCHGYGLFLFS